MTYDVIIVGGGVAGLSAAATLARFGYKLALCEAGPHLGGRCLDQVFTQKIDETNPLQAVLRNPDLGRQLVDDLNAQAFDSAGTPISLATLHRSLDPEYHKAIEGIQKAKSFFPQNSQSLANVLGYQAKTEALPKTDSPEYWARKFITATITQHTGAALDEVSLLELIPEAWGSAENYILTNSHDKLINALYQDANANHNLSCFLNTQIVKVEQSHINSVTHEKNSILVTDNQGKTYAANAIVMAVPFSILKHHQIQFVPELSIAKQTALKNFGVSYYNAVILEFEQVFWDKAAHYLFPNGPDIEDWPQYLNVYPFEPDKKPVLIAQFSGKKARFGHQTDALILEQVLAPIQRIYKDNIAPLKSYSITRFDTDPNILGGSLYCSLQNRLEDFDSLAKPEQAIYFAGDYTFANRHGNVEAAAESGIQAGLQLHTYLRYRQSLQREEHLRPKP